MSTHTPNFNLNIPEDTDSMDSFFDDYEENMNIIDDNLGGGGGATIEEMTLAEYETLPSSKNSDGVLRAIKDVESLGEMAMTNIYAPVIYSETEYEIGAWVDDKPVHQKVFHFANPINVSYGDWTDMGVSVTNGENVIMCEAVSSDGTHTPLLGYFDSGAIKCQTPRNSQTWNVEYLILQYTKSSDTAGSASYNSNGVPTRHYSMAEQVVGTWIDGKPIYEKTIDCGNLPNASSKTINHGIANLKYVISCECLFDAGTWGGTIPFLSMSGATFSQSGCIAISYTDTTINISAGANRSGCVAYATLRYTKTTD